jgi:hypothetical protein
MTAVLEQELGKEGDLKVEIKEGKVTLAVGLDTKGVDVAASVTVDVSYFLGKLKAAIPGNVDDVIIDALDKIAIAMTKPAA